MLSKPRIPPPRHVVVRIQSMWECGHERLRCSDRHCGSHHVRLHSELPPGRTDGHGARSFVDDSHANSHRVGLPIGGAGHRPGESRDIRETDCVLPEGGWGEILLAGSYQEPGQAWTDDGESGEQRGLKHRHSSDSRPTPAHPELVRALRDHLEEFGTGVGGRLFVARAGRAGVPISPPYAKPVSMKTVYRVWEAARRAALTEQQVASPLAARPYDLRHACLSTWLNAGVAAPRVAAWAGHSVTVLHKVYSKCIDGEEEAAKKRIEASLAALD